MATSSPTYARLGSEKLLAHSQFGLVVLGCLNLPAADGSLVSERFDEELFESKKVGCRLFHV